MVTVVLRGGLGNQMFEYAAGFSVALEKKTGLVLDTTYLNDRFPRRDFSYRTYDLDVFKIKPQFTALSKASSAMPIPGVWLGIDIGWCTLKKILGAGNSPVLFWGRYQGERYFKEHQREVREAFRFRQPLTGVALDIAKEIQQTNSVALHVRRGDYLLPKYQQFYGSTDVHYYDRAVAHIVERVKDPHFFVFSDDIAWCRENIKPQFPTNYVDDASRGPKAAFHLELISLCKHDIIANSSFSWWGAWLNRNPEKMVIAPRRWLADSNGAEDIVPDGWIKL